MTTTELQKPFTDEQLKAWTKLGPLSFGSTIGFQAPRYRVLSHDGTITPVCVAWVDAELTCDPGKGWRVVSIPLQTKMVLSAPDLAARVLELEAENKRLREGLTKIGALHPEATELSVRIGKIIRAALKGGEI
jgi:hypothetical protein